MKYKYGDVILESKSYEQVYSKLLELKCMGYKIGDLPAQKVNLEVISYCIILNDDKYVDVEYRVPIVENKIISLSELKSGYPLITE